MLLACRPVSPLVLAPPRIGLTGATPELTAALERAGAAVVPLVPGDRDAVDLLDGLDGLVLGPGADVDPALYGEVPDPTVRLIPPDRQDQDLALARAALASDRPLLGVCLGAQELAVALGGSLIQDIPTQVGVAVAHRGDHPVTIVPGSRLAEWYGPGPIEVVSNHHQAVGRIPDRATVAARAPDGVVEALVVEDRRWAVGQQFHPERDGGTVQDPMWTSFVAACRSP